MNDIVMPRLSDSMTEGTVVRWLKAPGQQIARGEPLAEIETDKATITYESDVDGVLSQILVGEGQTVPVGTQIAIVQPVGAATGQQPPAPLPTPPTQTPAPLPTPPGQAPPPLAVPPTQAAPLPTPPADPRIEQPFDHQQFEQDFTSTGEYENFTDAPAAGLPPLQPPAQEFPVDDTFAQQPTGDTGEYAQPGVGDTGDFGNTGEFGDTGQYETSEFAQAGGQPGERVKASPIARRLARRLGVDIATVAGSGPDGRIVKEDIEAAADAAAQRAAQTAPTQSPAPDYAYEPGGVERTEDQTFSTAAHGGLTPNQPPISAPNAPGEQPSQPPAQDPPLIPHFPPPPQAAPGYPPGYMPQPGYAPYGVPPGYPPQQYPPQPFPAPPPFVQGMTGGFPAIDPNQQYPTQQQPPQQQPPQQQPQPPQPGATPTATRGHSTPIQPTSAQQTVARRMAESKATAPEFFLETEVDMTMAVAFREQLRNAVDPLPSYNDFVFKASALALKQYPNVNAAYKDGHFEQYSDVNIGMVVSATDLLAVPTLFNVDEKGLAQIARESHDLAESVRNRAIQPAQLSGGTFSISNLGMYGVERFTAILNPPQAAILAVGAITRKAVIAEDGMSLVVRQMMAMTLTCDHRILYGAEAAEFLAAIKAWLENPQMLQL